MAAGRRWCTCCTPGRTGLNAHLWLDGEVDVDRHELPTDVFAGSTRRAAGRDGSVETRELYAWRCLRRPVHCGLCAAQLHTCTSTQKRQIPDTRISQPHTPSHTHTGSEHRRTPRRSHPGHAQAGITPDMFRDLAPRKVGSCLELLRRAHAARALHGALRDWTSTTVSTGSPRCDTCDLSHGIQAVEELFSRGLSLSISVIHLKIDSRVPTPVHLLPQVQYDGRMHAM